MVEKPFQILLSESPLDREACIEFVKNSGSGALVVFEGWVRNKTSDKTVKRLEFEAYEEMAVKEMEKIALDVVANFAINRIALHHRTGTLQIGEIPVLIAVSAPHRKDAFAACQFAIDTLKETVPLWKKEIFSDGEVWVSSHP